MMNAWLLDKKVCFLNHGSYGAVPVPVLDYQRELRERMERQPLAFLGRELEGLLDEARSKLAFLVNINPDALVFIPNATIAVNTILRSLNFEPGDEILINDHTYNACANAVRYIAATRGIRIVTANLPFPFDDSRQIATAILDKISPKTRLVLIDHVTSPTAFITPVEVIVKECNRLGIDTLIDGAHALGYLPLDIKSIDPTYYTANCHKWLCSPKGAAFLYVKPEKQPLIRPLSISHGANSPRTDKSLFQLEFGWTGTDDPTAYLSVPRAIDFLTSLYGDFNTLLEKNRELALKARKLLCEGLKVDYPCPESTIGAMASIFLPDNPYTVEELYGKLTGEHNIEIPVIPWGEKDKLIRISAQYYNSIEQYEYFLNTLNNDFRICGGG